MRSNASSESVASSAGWRPLWGRPSPAAPEVRARITPSLPRCFVGRLRRKKEMGTMDPNEALERAKKDPHQIKTEREIWQDEEPTKPGDSIQLILQNRGMS